MRGLLVNWTGIEKPNFLISKEILDRTGDIADCSVGQRNSQLCQHFLLKSFENICNHTAKAKTQKIGVIQKALTTQKVESLKKPS
jgi:hypothetical protein